jgi:ubiquinol-cytochrome c reductase iron-sulfur subunit
MDRRKVITRLLAGVGAIGVGFLSIPFIQYFRPSARAKSLGSAVAIEIGDFQPGEVRKFLWRGQVVIVMKRTTEQIEALELTRTLALDNSDPNESQPDYVDDSYRSVRPDFLVILGNCTHAGCVPLPDTETGRKLLGSWWPGGFHCPCHDSMYDNAGRVVRGPAPFNLRVPRHRFASDSELIIGEGPTAS